MSENQARRMSTDESSSSDPDDAHDSGHQARSSLDDDESQSPGRRDNAPSWADLKTKAGKERKRLPLACMACRKRKIKCSGERPDCTKCVHSGMTCRYEVSNRKPPPRTDYMAMLDKRLKRMEDRVRKVVPAAEAQSSLVLERANVRPHPSTSFSPRRSVRRRSSVTVDRNADMYRGAVLDFVDQTEDPRLEGLSEAGSTFAAGNLFFDGARYLPGKELQLHLADVYFDYLYGQPYQLLHRPSFMKALLAGTVNPILSLSLCAVSARFSTHPLLSSEPPFLRGESWAAEARRLVLRWYDEPSTTILTSAILLSLHEFGTCHGERSRAFAGMALQMAFTLRLHLDLNYDPHDESRQELLFVDRELRRRLMWACYLMDQLHSGTNRPIPTDEANLRIPLPLHESFFMMGLPGESAYLGGLLSDPATPEDPRTFGSPGNSGLSAYILWVTALWGRVSKYTASLTEQRDLIPMWSEESQFARLRCEAKVFKRSLPASFQVSPENLSAHTSERSLSQLLFLHIMFNHVMLSLTRFGIPSLAADLDLRAAPTGFRIKLRRKAVESASQISGLINRGAKTLLTAPFVGYCAYLSGMVHAFGLSSNDAQVKAQSQESLAICIKHLNSMAQYWGMFQFVVRHLEESYGGRRNATSDGAMPRGRTLDVLQFSDLFERFPNGVSNRDHRHPAERRMSEVLEAQNIQYSPDSQPEEQSFAAMPTLLPTLSPTHPSRVHSANPDGTHGHLDAMVGPHQYMPSLEDPNMAYTPTTFQSSLSVTSATDFGPLDVTGTQYPLGAHHFSPDFSSPHQADPLLHAYPLNLLPNTPGAPLEPQLGGEGPSGLAPHESMGAQTGPGPLTFGAQPSPGSLASSFGAHPDPAMYADPAAGFHGDSVPSAGDWRPLQPYAGSGMHGAPHMG